MKVKMGKNKSCNEKRKSYNGENSMSYNGKRYESQCEMVSIIMGSSNSCRGEH